jgi:hypothetical protein
MSKNSKTTRQVILSARSSPADRSKVEPAGEKFFDQGGLLCANLGVAWPRELKFNFPDGSHLIFSRPKSKNPAITRQQIDIVHQLLMPMFLDFCESIAPTEGERDKVKIWKKQYDTAVFAKLSNEREKAGAEWLRALQLAELYHRENPSRGSQVVAMIQTAYGSPLFAALIKNDTEFVRGILEQMRHFTGTALIPQ